MLRTVADLHLVDPAWTGPHLPKALGHELNGKFSAICKSGFDASGVSLDRDSNGNPIDQIVDPVAGTPFPGNPGIPVDTGASNFAKLPPFPVETPAEPLPMRSLKCETSTLTIHNSWTLPARTLTL